MRSVFTFFLFFLLTQGLCAQGNVTDSLLQTFNDTTLSDLERIKSGLEFSKDLNRSEPLKGLEFNQKLLAHIEQSESLPDSLEIAYKIIVLSRLGTVYSYIGDTKASVESYLAELELAQKYDDQKNERLALNSLGVAYQNSGFLEEAISYYKRSLKLAEEQNNTYDIAMALGNIGTALTDLKSDSSLWFYQQSLEVMKKPDMLDQAGAMGWMMNNIGFWFEEQGQPDSAFYYYYESIKIRESIDHRLGLYIAHRDLARLYKQTENLDRSLYHINKSLDISTENGFTYELDQSYILRSELRYNMGDFKGALEDHKLYVLYKDSISNDRNTKELVQQTTRYEYNQKHLADSLSYLQSLAMQEMDNELEQTKLRQTRNTYLISGIGIFLLSIALWSRLNYVRKSRTIIAKERDRSDKLLLNILPEEVAEELKQKGEADAKRIEQVTVMFTDFEGFTAYSQRVSPEQLVKDLHESFSAFDRIIAKYNIEKIKTIGDAYMAAGGLPSPSQTHAKDVVFAALEIRDFIIRGKEKKIKSGHPYFDIRIGIHTGPVVAGIVGVKKFSYDIWGDTVNTANRLEGTGEVGQVNISQTTYEILKNDSNFTFESRGKIEAKGKGEMEMWFVSHRE